MFLDIRAIRLAVVRTEESGFLKERIWTFGASSSHLADSEGEG
jgi:hypothetical protein